MWTMGLAGRASQRQHPAHRATAGSPFGSAGDGFPPLATFEGRGRSEVTKTDRHIAD
jgi:hypothetical protein